MVLSLSIENILLNINEELKLLSIKELKYMNCLTACLSIGNFTQLPKTKVMLFGCVYFFFNSVVDFRLTVISPDAMSCGLGLNTHA